MAITYHAGRRIQGLSTDIANTLTLDEDFSTYTTQGEADAVWIPTNTSTDVNLTTDQVEIRTSTTAQGGYISLNGGSSISDSEWICRFRFKINTKQPCVIIVSDNTSTDSTTLIDGIGLRITDTTSYLDVECPNGEASTSATIDHRFTHTPANQEYYIEIIRLSESSCKVNLYEDAYSTLIESSGNITGISGITSLKYLVFQSRGTNTQNTDIDDIQFYNGVSSLSNKPTNVQSGSRFEETDTRKIYYGATPSVTFEADFSSSTGWTTTGSNISVDTTAQEIDFTFNTDDADKSVSYYDLTTVSDTNWVLRSQIDIDTVTQGSETNDVFLMYGLGSTVQDGSEVQDFLGLMFRLDDTKTDIFAIETDGSAPNNETTTLFTRQAQAETLYVELKRDSATSFTINLYSDSGYSTLLESKTITASSGTTTLRYLKVTGLQGFANSSLVGSIPNIKFYNGVTSTDLVWTEEV